MRLIDKPKEYFDEETDFQLPINFQSTMENNNLEGERIRKDRFRRESEMIDFTVRMGKGYILKQIGVR